MGNSEEEGRKEEDAAWNEVGKKGAAYGEANEAIELDDE
jgi:hypothetical protein